MERRRGRAVALAAALALTAIVLPTHMTSGNVMLQSLSDFTFDRAVQMFTMKSGDGFLQVGFCTDNIVHVGYARDRAFLGSRKTLAVESPRCAWTPVSWSETPQDVTLASKTLHVRIDRETAAVTFLDTRSHVILREKARALTPAVVQDANTFHVRQEWQPNDGESLYGLGQHQLGLMDIKGYDLDLWQHNGTVIVPFFVSSKGYGILWDNTAYSRWGDLREAEPVEAVGGFTGSYYAGESFDRLVATRVDPRIDIEIPQNAPDANQRIHPDLPPRGNVSVRWEGEVAAPETGDYLFETFSNAGVKFWIDDRLLIDRWRQGWLPWWDVTRVRFDRGSRHRLRLEWTKDQGMETMRLLWKTPAASPSTSLWSEVGDGVDYYFVYGPSLDRVVAGYRRATGDAPMMPIWAFGLWQSRERYRTSQESLDVLAGFRSRGIPIDTIVQDWQYWKEDAWGSHQFDRARFPDPDAWVREIHDKYHARLMLSVWGKFYPGTPNFEAMRSRGFLYEPNLREGLRDWLNHPYTFYDAFNPEARRLFWSQIERDLFHQGIDAWWMDATEPDLMPTPTLEGQRTHVHPTALGPGTRVLNAYSLVNSEAVYDGQRQAAPDQRVFILTRSAFAGQQRYAAATWSGDITSTWGAFRAQIPAGLSFALSGLPYWTTDIGGFSVPPRFASDRQSPEAADEWRELNARWFQFGTFCPLLRVHGQFPYREMWQLGEGALAYHSGLKFDRLRYRLLPYNYSLAAMVTFDGGTIMRPLVMDFPEDANVWNIGDEYMFGPAFLVNPVTTYKARSRSVYLPSGSEWYDFWTGAIIPGGQTFEADAPLYSLPLYVRAGSIVPLGPELRYTTEKPQDPITLYVYTGRDADFTLYEDDGVSYGYERGARSRIPVRWSERSRTLTIGQRQGAFPGMLQARTFTVVFASKTKPVRATLNPPPDRTVRYSGVAVEVRFP
jgi:alpha-D-xyloside xylohydrolase